MATTDRSASRGWYDVFGRRLFFSMDPERSHRVALATLALPLPWARIGHDVADPGLATSVAGVPLANPIGLASGFDKSCERFRALGRLGFGYVVGGTVTRAPRPGNARPRIARDPSTRALVNAMGLPNPGAAAVAATLAHQAKTTSRWVSLADEAVEDVAAALDLLAPHVDAFELNASSPNAGWTHRADHVSRGHGRHRAPLARAGVREGATLRHRRGARGGAGDGAGGAGHRGGRDHLREHGPGAGPADVDRAWRALGRTAHRAHTGDRRGRALARPGRCRSTPAAASSRPPMPGPAWRPARPRSRSTPA